MSSGIKEEFELKVPHGVSAFQHRAAVPPTHPTVEGRAVGSLSPGVPWDPQNIVTPSKPCLSKAQQQCTEGWDVEQHMRKHQKNPKTFIIFMGSHCS